MQFESLNDLNSVQFTVAMELHISFGFLNHFFLLTSTEESFPFISNSSK